MSKEYISPEGVEERLVERLSGFVTLTQGGKFRVYINDFKDGKEEIKPHPRLFDSFEEASEMNYKGLAVSAHMCLDLEGTMKQILNVMEKGNKSNG